MGSKKIPIPWSRRFESLRHRVLPIAVWVAAVVGVVQLVEMRGGTMEYLGLAEVTDYVVAAPADGMLQDLQVGLYDEVAAGQIVATMDMELLSARIRTAAVEAEQLAAEQVAVANDMRIDAANIERDWEKDARRFEMDAVDLRLDLLRGRIKLETARIEADRVLVAFERSKALVEAEAASEAEAEDLELAHQVLLEEIRTTEELVDRLTAEHERALARSQDFLSEEPEDLDLVPRLEALRLAMQAQELRLAEIEIERVGMVLRSPVSGQVHLVSATAGRSIILGQEILAITPTVGKSVVFYQPALNDGRLAVGDQMEVRLPGQARILNALIEVMSPVIEEIPAALWRDPAVPEYGRAARLSPMPELELVPGAPVQVSISER